jgi:hypothetical protein
MLPARSTANVVERSEGQFLRLRRSCNQFEHAIVTSVGGIQISRAMPGKDVGQAFERPRVRGRGIDYFRHSDGDSDNFPSFSMSGVR